jgi:hypothetical protein
MSSKYKFVDGEAIYFVTATVVGWAEVFTRTIYRDIPPLAKASHLYLIAF